MDANFSAKSHGYEAVADFHRQKPKEV